MFRRFEPSSRPTSSCYYHLPLPLTTYRCHLPPGLPSTVGIATRRPIPTSPRFAFGFLLLSYDPLWFLSPLGPRSLVLCGSLHHLTPRRGGRSVSAAPSSLPLFLHKAVVSRTLPNILSVYPLWVFTLSYPVSARLPSDLLKIRDNSSSLPRLGRDTYSTVVSEATFQNIRGHSIQLS